MNGKKDGPGKEPPRANEPEASKRPHAMIDLKATEVERKDAKPGAPAGASPASSGKPSPGPSADQGKSPAAAAASPEPKPSQPKPGDDTAAASATSKSDPQKSEAPGGKPAAAASPKPSGPELKSQGYAEPRRSTGSPSLGSTVSHLAAGALGGILTLLATDAFAPQLSQYLGWPRAPVATTDTTTGLQDRIATLERKLEKAAPSPDLAQRLASLDSRAQEIDTLSQTVSAMKQAQDALKAEAAALAEKQGRPGAPEADSARIAALEERLAVLAAAAGSDPEKGGIPQLAAITGKLADLESALSTQMAQVRASVPREVEARLADIASTSEAAKSGASRLDRDLAIVKTDLGRLAQRAEGFKAEDERITQNLRAVQEEAGALRSALDGLKGDLDAKLKSAAKPADIAASLAPVTTKLSTLEASLQDVIKSEQDRKINAERIVISLGLADLKRTVDRGQPYAAELAEVRKVAAGRLDLMPLERFKDQGVPSVADLAAEFRPIANAVIDAENEPADASVMDRLLAGAKSVIRVRKVSHSPDDASTEAVVARMEASLKEGRLEEVLTHAKSIPQRATVPAQAWLGKVEARNAVDRAIASIETQLKDSLSSTPAAPAGDPAPKASN